jgi:hypothetical protein
MVLFFVSDVLSHGIFVMRERRGLRVLAIERRVLAR